MPITASSARSTLEKTTVSSVEEMEGASRMSSQEASAPEHRSIDAQRYVVSFIGQ